MLSKQSVSSKHFIARLAVIFIVIMVSSQFPGAHVFPWESWAGAINTFLTLLSGIVGIIIVDLFFMKRHSS